MGGVVALNAIIGGLERTRVEKSVQAAGITPLLGAEGYHGLVNQARTLAQDYGLETWRMEHLLNRYGGRIDDLLELIARQRLLASPVPGAEDYLDAEVVHAVTHAAGIERDRRLLQERPPIRDRKVTDQIGVCAGVDDFLVRAGSHERRGAGLDGEDRIGPDDAADVGVTLRGEGVHPIGQLLERGPLLGEIRG